MTDDPTSPEALAASLGLERMHPPEFVAFFGGLPRRVTALVIRAKSLDGEDDDNVGDAGKGDGKAKPGVDPTDELVEIAEAVDRLTDRTRSVGSTTATDAEPPPIDLSVLGGTSPEIEALLDRIETASIDVTRRIAGLSSNEWNRSPGLIDDVRSTVIEVVGPLRAVERRIQRYSDG